MDKLLRNTAMGAVLFFLLIVAVFSVKSTQQDWHYFSIKKQIGSWHSDAPPTMTEVNALALNIAPTLGGSPNMLREYALVLEWKALLDPSNQRFYLYGAEESLRQAVVLRPTDSRSWAHLALVKSKLYRETSDINACYQKAKRLGAGDAQTAIILKRVLTG